MTYGWGVLRRVDRFIGGGLKAVYAVNEGAFDTVQYRVFTDPSGTVSFTAAELNANTMGTPTNWTGILSLSAPEGNNDETETELRPQRHLAFIPAQPARTTTASACASSTPTPNTFGGPTVQSRAQTRSTTTASTSPIHSQDASGRLHVVWRTLHDGNRLRYTRSDDGGATFSARPRTSRCGRRSSTRSSRRVPTGTGFAAWRGSGSAIRVVPIDPQPEPDAGPGGPAARTPRGPPRAASASATRRSSPATARASASTRARPAWPC